MEPDQSLAWDSENLISVRDFNSAVEAQEYALVVLAMGVPCFITESESEVPGRLTIFVNAHQAAAVGKEFALYASEQAERKPAAAEDAGGESSVELAVLWVIIMTVMFRLQSQDPMLTDLLANSSVKVIDQGEWWRPLTALFLHADVEHLLGNLVFGVVFSLLVSSSFGFWRSGLLILASGALGNALSAVVHYPSEFRSLGASTAVFGALGILVGLGIRSAWRLKPYKKLSGIIVPVGAGIALLGWLGSGPAPTDVLSHAFGFLFGGVFGWVAALRWAR